MIDKRLEKIASILIEHSLNLEKNDIFIINGPVKSLPLIKEVYRQAIEKGAHP
ncbi:MAG: aminopeptidase, partial [Candidatus Thermoplasmatota archaeon]